MKTGKAPQLSIKLRITLWYAVLLLAVCALSLLLIATMSERAAYTYYADTLRSAAVVIMDEMEIEHGMMEIDTDIDDVPNVYASLFEEDGALIYGRSRVDEPFEDDVVRETRRGRHNWYIHDTYITFPNRAPVWLRLYMSADLSANVETHITGHGFWLLPALCALALLGGFAITARAFRPVKAMSELAASIADGNDLSRRVRAGGQGADELHALADTLNEMLDRLENAFTRESRFASDAAHELRTPLNAMRTQGEYALSREDAQEKDEAIARMLDKGEEMRLLIDQLLMIARMDAGELKREDECDLAAMLRGVAEEMALVADERHVRIVTEIEPCTLRGNRAMLTRAAINLVDNAIRYGRMGGCVRLSLQREGDAAVISVADDGPGLREEELAHVFDRFWRSDMSRSTPGTGIGLAIVRAAAQAHSGQACVLSEQGRGCTFTITLPVNAAQKNAEK